MSKQVLRLVGAVAAVLSLSVLAASPVRAQDAPVRDDGGPTNVGDALEGRVADVTASAQGGFVGETIQLTLSFESTAAEPVELAVPIGALFASEDPTEQTIATAGLAEVGAGNAVPGEDPVITVPPGTSTFELTGYCAQALDQGPNEVVPLRWAGVADAPLTTVLANIDEQRPDAVLAQDAVWWVTDEPFLPVRADLAPLLEGVDTEAFAEAPTRAVPDALYTPIYEGGYEGDGYPGAIGPGGSGGSLMGPVVAVAALVATGMVVALVASARSSHSRPAGAPAAVTPPGWYADPGNAELLRYWDGGRWTSSTRYR